MMLKSLMPKKAQPENVERTLTVMLYELGHVSHGIVYATNRRQGKDPDERVINGYLKEAEMNLADLVVQCKLLAEQMGWDLAQLIIDGEERFKERMQELREGII